MSYILWLIQSLLAVVFLFAGGVKLFLPLEIPPEHTMPPEWFLRFIGLAEVTGALGLILPATLGIRPGLTPLAAAGLVVIMIGATSLTAINFGVSAAMFPFVTGLFAALVAFGRWRLAPFRQRQPTP
ncbi:MAG TPA: DoxX family protein [Acidobacteriota bacterium]|nr:DoxX family protein [Acidobacteriota bacterium]